MNGFSHLYTLDESIFILRGIKCIFSFLFNFSMKIVSAKRIATPDGTPRFAVSHLGLFCLPMSHKKDDRLIWVKKDQINRNLEPEDQWSSKPSPDYWSDISTIRNFDQT